MIHLVPGDPVQTMLGFRATPENVVDGPRSTLGLDRPLLAQYLDGPAASLHGNFGQDFISHAPVSTLLAQRLPVTIELDVASMTLAVAVGVPLWRPSASSWPGAVRQATEGFVDRRASRSRTSGSGSCSVLLFADIWQCCCPRHTCRS